MLSKPIFDLIDSACKWDAQIFRSLLSSEFEEFRKQYYALAEIRELQLQKYLSEKRQYRTFFPVSNHTFDSIDQVIWYYDEIILADPMLSTLSLYNNNELAQIATGADAIDCLNKFRVQIETGFVLLTNAGTDIDHNVFRDEAENLFQFPSISDGFASEMVLWKKPAFLRSGENVGMLQLRGAYIGWSMVVQPLGMYIPDLPEEKRENSLDYVFPGTYWRMSRSELKSLGKENIISDQTGLFITDISQIIASLHSAGQVNCPANFFRHVDFNVASIYANGITDPASEQLIDNKNIYRCTLPFVEGISPERLMHVRSEMPEAFILFRGMIARLYAEAMDKGFQSEELREWIRAGVLKERMNLEKEMKTLLRKAKYTTNQADHIYRKGSLSESPGKKSRANKIIAPLKTNPTFLLWKTGH